MRTTLYHIKLGSTVGHQELRLNRSKGTLEYLSRRIPVAFGHGRTMVLIIIFSVGKIDRSSNKDGSGYRAKPPMKFRHLEYFVAAAEELNNRRTPRWYAVRWFSLTPLRFGCSERCRAKGFHDGNTRNHAVRRGQERVARLGLNDPELEWHSSHQRRRPRRAGAA